MVATRTHSLVKLGDTELTVADKAEDIRGRTVKDRAGEEIGKVDNLIMDEQDAKVRFMEVAAGGFLGIGEKKFLIPVDAIARIDEDHVHVDQTRAHVASAPDYDPTLVPEWSYYEDVYGYYGFAPYWAPGYAYPAYPSYA